MGENACMYRISLSHQDERHRITPRHRDTAQTLDEAIGKVRGFLPGVDLSALTKEAVGGALQRINDFRCDAPAVEGGAWRVVIAPMI